MNRYACASRISYVFHMDMRAVLARIQRTIKEKGGSEAAISLAAGMSKDGIRNWRRKVTEDKPFSASYENLARVAEELEVDLQWLVEGKLAPSIVDVSVASLPGADLVPVYNVEASAGRGLVSDIEYATHQLAFPKGYLRRITSSHPDNLTIIEVKGDSMEPTLRDEDIVMLDMSKTSPGYEGLFVIRMYDVLHVKRLSHAKPGFVEVISDNRANYPPRTLPVDDVEVVGKVLWSGGKV